MKIEVAAALVVERGRLLICQRSVRTEFPGQWEFPGGKIEPGEDPQAALRRELEEELGIVAEVGKEVWRGEHQYPGRAPVLLHFFAVPRYHGAVQNRVFERICWVLPEELAQYDFLEGDRALIRELATGHLRMPLTAPDAFREAGGALAGTDPLSLGNQEGEIYMIVVCNRIPVAKGKEAEFERLFLERDDSGSRQPLSRFPGFIRNDILRPTREEPYVVLTYWESLEDFESWTRSESFREAHGGRSRAEIFAGHPNLEIHQVIKTTLARSG